MSIDQSFAFGSVAWLIGIWTLVMSVRDAKVRNSLAYILPAIVIVLCWLLTSNLNPALRLALSSLILLYTFKAAALLKHPLPLGFGLVFYSLVWPGIDPAPFQQRTELQVENSQRFARGMVCLILGVASLLVTAGFLPYLSFEVATWLAVASLLLAVHFGFSNVLSEVTFALGWKVQPLFDAPFRSTSLSNFWSQRWNRPFVEMNKIFFLPWLARRFGMKAAIFIVFLISGFLHELAISYPAGAGFGLPLLYFAIQGVLVLLERHLKVKGSLWVMAAILLPVPILFHGAFRQQLILPFLEWIHRILIGIGIQNTLSALILILGIAQFCILVASFQVPTRLRWREELPRLSSLNQKLMWTYGSFIVFTIVSWGILTLILRQEILDGTRAGLAVSTVIFLFWGLRLLTDTFYFKSTDWPKGPFMQIGHVMLNCLFTFVFLGYGSILGWHMYHTFIS